MKKSKSDIVLLVFKIIILVAVTFYLACSVTDMAMTEQETGWEALGFVVLFVFGFIVNGAALAISLIFFIVSLKLKSSLKKNYDGENEGYQKRLKRKNFDILHFGLLMAYAVVAEVVIYVAGMIIF